MSSSNNQIITNFLIKDDQQQFIAILNLKVPINIMIRIGQFSDVRQLNSLSQCNSKLLALYFNVNNIKEFLKDEKEDESIEFSTVQELIWKRLVFSYYPKFKRQLNIKNWMHVLRRRLKHVRLYQKSNTNQEEMFKLDIPSFVESKNDEMFIENCEWLYKCPLSFENLDFTTSMNVRFCNVCRKNVYKVYSMKELKTNMEKGRCVAYSSPSQDLFTSSMGSCVPPPSKTIKKKTTTNRK